MGAVWFLARTQLRAGRRATVLVALLVAVAGGSVLAAVAGARRTDSAMGRFLAYNRPQTVAVSGRVAFDAVRALPQVASGDEGAFVLVVPPKPSAEGPDLERFGSLNAVAPLHGTEYSEMDRPLVVAGRRPDAARPEEAAVSERVADRLGLRPGRHLTVYAYAPDQLEEASEGAGTVAPRGPAVDLTVTGIERQPFDVSPPLDQDVVYSGGEWLYFTPAFWTRYGGQVATFGVRSAFLLRHGLGDVDAFAAAVEELPGGAGADVEAASDNIEAARTARAAAHAQAVALYLFAALAGLVALAVLSQLLRGQALADAVDRPALQASGMTRRQLRGAMALRSAPAAAMGAAGAVAAAVLASPIMPMGVARRAEIHRGVSVDGPVLLKGALLLTVVVVILAAVGTTSSRPRRRRQPPLTRPRPAALLFAASAPLACGIRFAFTAGRTRVLGPVRLVLTGIVVATAALTAAVTFGASLGHLLRTPRLQGWNWDVAVGNPHSLDALDRTAELLRADSAVAAFSAVLSTDEPVSVGGHDARAAALAGDVFAPVLEGRRPQSDDEVALGSGALGRAHRRVGDRVDVRGAEGSASYQIVGRVEVPASIIDSESMADGALFSPAGLEHLVGELEPATTLVRYVPGTDEQAEFVRLRHDHGRTVLRPLAPTSVANLARVKTLPYALAALLTTLALGTLGYTLATSVRDHRRDLAVLQSLGFRHNEVRRTIAWQATAIVLVALAVAVPLGVAGGRWAWRLVADRLGTAAEPRMPLSIVGLIGPLAVLAANLIAAVPARAATRLRPAVVLRAE